MGLQQSLNSPLNIRLFKRATMVLFLAVLEGLTLLLPIEFKINVSSSCGNWVGLIDQFDDGLRDVTLRVIFNCNSVQFRVEMEVLRHHLERHFDQTLDIV